MTAGGSKTLEWSDASAALLPAPAPAGTPAGTVGDGLPRARGAVLAIGGHDHLSAAVGAGVVGDGDVLDSCGTAEALIRATAPVGPGVAPGLVWRAALEAAGSSAAAILRNMESVAGPRRRLVVAGGWAEGAAARHVKAAHLGPFMPAASTFVGARGAALKAGRAAGIVEPI